MSMTKHEAVFEDRVRVIAHGLWLHEGQPEGRAEAHWLQASEMARDEAVASLTTHPVPPELTQRRTTVAGVMKAVAGIFGKVSSRRLG